MKRRGIIALATAAVLAMTLSPAQAAQAANTGFSDVPQKHLFAKEISWLADEGISTGWRVGNRTEFRPSRAVTRDAMAAFLYRLAGEPEYTAPAHSPFRDVSKNLEFYKEINWLADQKISEGWRVGNSREFRPFEPITRDAMAAFLYRFADRPSYTASNNSPFRDIDKSLSFYKEMSWLASQGISTGSTVVRGCRDYRPYEPVARDAMAAFMYRLENGGTSAPPANDCRSIVRDNLDNPASVTVVVNKMRPFRQIDWAPGNLVMPKGIANLNNQPLRPTVARAVEKMHADARAAGINLQITSAYRSYNLQRTIFNNRVNSLGRAAAEARSARPGHSEHQTGLAIDFVGGGCALQACFGETAAGKWLRANGYKYGFILRYDRGEQPVVGFQYEPWHFRYVGVELATEMRRLGVKNLEDYYGLPAAPDYRR